MLDIKYIRTHREEVEKNNEARKVNIDLNELLVLDEERAKLQQKIDDLRAERNKRSKTKPSEEEISLMKKLGEEITDLEDLAEEKLGEVRELLFTLPNLTHSDVPTGKDESGNKVIRKVGEIPVFNFQPKEHYELGEALGIIDLKTAAEVSGSRFAYLKGKLVLLELALLHYTYSVLTNETLLREIIVKNNLSVSSKPFVPIIPPVLIKPDVMRNMGRLEPREERYHIDSDDLYLVGSAEHTLGPMHMNQTIKEADLPIRYLGFSTAFRREAGSYGKDTKGIFRVHQFDKIEMESFTTPEVSVAEQDFLVAIQEYLMQSLGIPYQVVLKCTGDMGLPDYREFDIESWMPGQGRYRETHTADLMTDYQARRLNIRVKQRNGSVEFAHMNDATTIAMSRTLIAIMENYQTAEGQIMVPEVLKKYTGFEVI
ncbi:MAG: serine--tRNA ligase [Candidatus Magasanikbacteria bacterium]|nr:serine--tRNA ligase [Candidatus Magasanikbacteria bacterium]